MTVTAALVATICLSLVSGARAAPRTFVAATRTVMIKQSGPVPKSVTIAVGATVRWLNATPRTHRVTADGSAFPAFSLAAGASHNFRFRRTGRYPYRVDTRLQGTIVVVAAGSSSGQGGSGQTGGSSCQGTCVSHYAVSIKGFHTYKDTSSGGPYTTGRTELYLEWTGQVPDVKVTVSTLGGRVEVDGGGKGIAQATLRFLESRPLWGGPCQGNVSGRPPITLDFSIGLSKDHPFTLSVDEESSSTFDLAVRKAERAACPGGATVPGGPASPGPSTTSMTLSDVPGPYGTVWFVATDSYLRIGIDRPHGSPTDYPFDQIRNGKPFTLERRLYTRNGRCNMDATCATVDIMDYKLMFKPINH